MLYQLRKLSSSEQDIMLKAPIWTSLLVACAKQHISESELTTAKQLIHTKTYSEVSDVKNIYQELDGRIEKTVDAESLLMPEDPVERIHYFEEKLGQLNKILPKLEHTYALQFYKSLRDLAMHIAKSEGGILGVGNINEEEAMYIKLPMINRP